MKQRRTFANQAFLRVVNEAIRSMQKIQKQSTKFGIHVCLFPDGSGHIDTDEDESIFSFDRPQQLWDWLHDARMKQPTRLFIADEGKKPN